MYGSKVRGAASAFSQCCNENGKSAQTFTIVFHQVRNTVAKLLDVARALSGYLLNALPCVSNPWFFSLLVSSTHRIRDVLDTHHCDTRFLRHGFVPKNVCSELLTRIWRGTVLSCLINPKDSET